MLKDMALKLKTALNKKELITLGAKCKIRYSGRAESFLETGDRLIIIKQDGSMFIHQPEGLNPVNYMKDGTSHIVVLEKDELKIQSSNIPRKEFMYTDILHSHFFFSQKLSDSEKIVLAGSEKDMAQMIYDNPSLIEEGFKPFSLEEHTEFGFIDIFGTDKNGTITIIECKRYSVDFNAVQQLDRYVEKIKKAKGIEEVRGILAAPNISANAKTHLKEKNFEFKTVKPPKYLEEIDKSQKKMFDF